MPANRLVLGSWNAICDVCGLKKKSYQLQKRWDGLMVCKDDYEPRHPSDLIRPIPPAPPPPWVRPEPTDQFELVCNLFTRSAYADLGTADCMTADNNLYTYAFLLSLYDDTLSPVGSAPPAPAPAPGPPSSPALKFNQASNSDYLALISAGGL